MNEKRKPVVLDCTLRDGGYYNNWDFDRELARIMIGALDESGVDIIELGYRSRGQKGWNGLFRYCDEVLLRPLLPTSPRADFAFMIDTKEFLDGGGRVDIAALSSIAPRVGETLFKWIRAATHPATLPQAVEQTRFFKERGYRVALNVMGISTLSSQALADALHVLHGAPVDVLYMADSYGSLTPQTTIERLEALRSGWSGAVGVHMHENQGLALANTLASIDAGVDFVDSTLTGMGRGAGNLRTEQLLLSLFFRYGRRDLMPAALLPVIRQHMLALQQEHGWGWDFSYMLSGLVGIHPTYCQELKAGARYELEEIARILEEIPHESRSRYDERSLLQAESGYAGLKSAKAGDRPVNQAYEPAPSEHVLIVANGPHTRRHAEGLRRFIARERPLVIECNNVDALVEVDRLTVVMNSVRLQELAAAGAATSGRRTLITGLSAVPAALTNETVRAVRFTMEPGVFTVEGHAIVLPGYVVGMLAVALALTSKPKRISLAGFDGFSDPARRAEHAEMETFWELIRRSKAAEGVDIVSVLPTSYVLAKSSIYMVGQP